LKFEGNDKFGFHVSAFLGGVNHCQSGPAR